MSIEAAVKKKLVIHTWSHMVSSTQCPAKSDPVKKWSESRAAALKGQCPVDHKGEFSKSPERAYFRLYMTDLGH